MAKTVKNNRCPLQKECGRKCEHVGAELNCDYYKNNGIGDSAIADQEAVRAQLAALKAKFADEDAINSINDTEDKAQIVYIPIDELHPHPDNPRKDLGDLTELAESIKEKGVMQNLTVVPRDEGGYTVIIGHRRCGASKIAGLTELPCVITYMTESEQVATMLLENMQRSDLTVYEQARGFQMMMDLGASVDDISQKTGFSKKTVKGRLKIAELDPEMLRKASAERQLSIGDFDKINQIDDIKKRNELLSTVGTNNFEYNYNRILKEQKLERAKPYVDGAVRALKGRKIQRSETYSGKYTKILEVELDKLVAGETVNIPAKHSEEKLFYCIDDYDLELRIYILTPKAAPVRRSKEELERERRTKEAHELLATLDSECYDLRFNFVKNLKVTKANEAAIREGAFLALILEQFYYISHTNIGTVYEQEGLQDLYYVDERLQRILDAHRADPKKLEPAIVYVSFGDRRDECVHSTYKNEYPKHTENKRLSLLYKWLCSCGYEMSDVELALMNGTHEVFRKEN